MNAPLLEDFENATVGTPGGLANGWINTSSGDQAWFVSESGVQNSPDTGPIEDHTAEGDKFIFLEASAPSAPGNTAELLSPCIEVGGLDNPALSFWYHMYGAGMGSLEVYLISPDTTVRIFSIEGQQQTTESAPWIQHVELLNQYGNTFQLLFKAIRGNAFSSDMALDDIRIFELSRVDVALSNIKPSAFVCESSSATVSLDLNNLGADPLDLTQNELDVTLTVEGGPAAQVFTQSINNITLENKEKVQLTFSNVDLSQDTEYTLGASIGNFPSDTLPDNNSLSATIFPRPSASTLPYREDFEQGDGGWAAFGINSSWQLGEPVNSIINQASSGANAWVTNLEGSYNPLENSFVISPCMDFSQVNNPLAISFDIWWNTETSWDGAVLQSSIDQGSTWQNVGQVGDPFNWYNDNAIEGNPGNQAVGWTGSIQSGTGSNTWVKAQHPLDPSILGQDQVFFRIAFGSDASGFDEGVAFDNVIIAVAPIAPFTDQNDYCPGDMLDALNPGAEYLWSTGATTQQIALENGTGEEIQDSLITVQITDSLGFSTLDSIRVNIRTVPQASFQFSQVGGTTSFSNTSTGTDNSVVYSWDFGDGTSESSENPNHVWMENGSFVVSLTASNDCGSTTFTDTLDIMTVGIDELFQSQIRIYPNPAQDQLFFDFQASNVIFPVSLCIPYKEVWYSKRT